MDFDWTPEEDLFNKQTEDFSRSELNRGLDERLRDMRFPREAWDECGRFGLLGLCIPEQYGGMGLGALSTAGVVEAFGYGCEDGGLVFSACAHLFACVSPIAAHGEEPLKERLLPGLCSGPLIGANAITEAEAGSDASSLRTSATLDGDEYVLNGAKSYVTNGPEADVFLVYATVNPAWGYMGVTAFVVEADTPGLKVGERFETTGLHTSPIGSVYLNDCRVPADHRIGKEGAGSAIFSESMQWERTCLFAGYLGSMRRQLEEAVDYAKNRRQFGRPIGKFQAISHKIADMRLRLDAARLLLHRACWLRDHDREADVEVALAKLAVSEAAIRSGLDAIQIFGGAGVTVETGVGRGLQDALPSAIFSGTSEVMRDQVAAGLGL